MEVDDRSTAVKNMKKMPKRSRGFTLIELMVVVGVIGVLGSVAMPEMRSAYLRSKTTERHMLMNAIASALKDFCNERINASQPCELTAANNPDPASPLIGGKRWFDRNMTGWKELAFEPTLPMLYNYRVDPIGGGVPGFIITATGDLDDDGDPAVRVDTWILEDGSAWNNQTIEDEGKF